VTFGLVVPVPLPDGGRIEYEQYAPRRYTVRLYTGRDSCIWTNRRQVAAIRPTLTRMRAILAGADLDRDDEAIAADERVREAWRALEREFNAG